MALRFSLVVPAHNEEAYLPRLLDTVDAARAAYHAGADAVEVIVADNLSTDRTAAIAAARGCRVVPVEKRVIGAVRNGGARAARGDVICFTDADMQVHPQTFNTIARAIQSGRYVGGATGALPDRWSLGIAVTVALMLPVAVVARIDTGVVFCRRDDYEAVGGYREDVLFAEDIAFLNALRRLGRLRRQRLTRATTARALASTRKFDKYGDWHYWTLPLKLLVDRIREPVRQPAARQYWYEDRQ